MAEVSPPALRSGWVQGTVGRTEAARARARSERDDTVRSRRVTFVVALVGHVGGLWGRRGGGTMRRLPAVGQEFRQAADGDGGDAGQHVAEVVERIDAVPLAGGDEAEQDRTGGPAVVAAAEQPVFSAQGDPAFGVLADIIG